MFMGFEKNMFFEPGKQQNNKTVLISLKIALEAHNSIAILSPLGICVSEGF
jgi:hypothetical protein